MNRRGKEWRELQAAMANDQEADHADFIKRRTHALRQMDLEKGKLITELADAMEKYLPADVRAIMLRPSIYRDLDQELAELIQRAREAVE